MLRISSLACSVLLGLAIHQTVNAAERLEPAPIERPGAPPPRTRNEVEAVLAGSQGVDLKNARKLTILLLASEKDHGVDEHDYPLWQKRWEKLLGQAAGVEIRTAFEWPSLEDFDKSDVIVAFSSNSSWTQARAADLEAFQAHGGGLVLLHWAVNGGRAPDQLAKFIGLAWGAESKYRHGEVDLKFRPDAHPITRNFDKLHLVDETYWQLAGDTEKITSLATSVEDGQPRPILWTHENGKGRVCCSLLGHYTWTLDDPLVRVLILRAIAWTAREPIDRFNGQVTIGARLR